MAYKVARCAKPEDLTRIFQEFFIDNPMLPWKLVRSGDNELGKVVVENTSIKLALGWNAITSYRKGINFHLGEKYSGGAWPGISSMKMVRQDWGSGTVAWPADLYFIAEDDYFILTVRNVGNNRCHNYGGGSTIGVGKGYAGFDGKWAAADWFDNNVGLYGIFLGGKKRHYGGQYVNNWYMDNGSGHWQAAGGGSPELLPPIAGVWNISSDYGEGVHPPYDVEKFVFKQSATTVFLPCLMGKRNNGWRPAMDIPYLRLCSMALVGPGDIVEYQGQRWRIIPRNNYQDANIGFALLESTPAI
ncbi:hypothetical protein [Photobacterium sanguinicancri]|uniref:Uncharacterized protein n=1 Tax=Photobacterium sanguinicancri TaxID=875932 RepID=A0ABX4G1N4_9GAMM|nr:hypothetical protein [Photobacterium sanguinicancri]OZS45063.1 hypothetical protein ASV53_05025 [Photobacterium sanguinicancri]